LTIAADPAGGPFAYRWLKDGVPIPSRGLAGGRFGDSNLPILRLASASVLDSGVYTCNITNGCGSVETVAATVSVNAPPSCPGDIADDFGTLGADGMVGFGDFMAMLDLIGTCPGMTPGCDGDIADGFGTLGDDGVVDFGDFLALLGLVGPCPSGTPGCEGDFLALLGLVGPCM